MATQRNSNKTKRKAASPARKKRTTKRAGDPAENPNRVPFRFTEEQRQAFLAYIAEGKTQHTAATLSDVNRKTIAVWLKSGRSERPKRKEHYEFALQYARAKEEFHKDVLERARVHAMSSDKVAMAFLEATDTRFGRSKARKEMERERLAQAKAQRRMSELTADMAELKLAAAREALKDKGKGGAALFLGIAALLDGEFSDGFKAELRAAVAQGRVAAAGARDLSQEPAIGE